MAGGFGSLPAFADLSQGDLADLLARIQGQQADAQAQPGSPQQLLFNRDSMGGGLNPFVAAAQADPQATGSLPQPQMVPLPPQRPSDADLAAPPPAPRIQGMNPDRAPGMPGVPAQPSVTAASTGNPDASNVAPVNSFDPLTGAPVSGSPKPMRAPGEGGPTEGAGRVASAAGAPETTGQSPSLLERFAKGLNNPAVGDLLLNIGMGLMSQRGVGPGIAAGLQGYQSNQGNQTKQLLQQYQLQQQIQGQNATRAYLQSKGLPSAAIEAATYNPAVLSSLQAQMNKDPTQMTVGGNVYLVPPGGKPGPDNLVGPSEGPPSGFQQTPNGLVPTPGGPQSIDYKKKVAEATASEKFLQVEQPDGSKKPYLVAQDEEGNTILQRPKGIPEETSSGNPYATGKFNSDQAKAAGFSDRMLGSEPVLRKYQTLNADNDYGPAGATIAGMLPNSMKTTERQQMDQAQRDFINAQLRRESGAAISPTEFESARQQYFPQPGDKPEVIAQKQRNRQSAIEAMAREGGSAYRPKSVFDAQGDLVPFGQAGGQRTDTPAQPSRSQLEAEARRRGLIK